MMGSLNFAGKFTRCEVRLTPHLLESTYDFLRSTKPFSGWGLPEADEVEFHITRHYDQMADCGISDDGNHCIRVSERRVAHTLTLVVTMAHEMVHLYLDLIGDRGADHGVEFRKKWKCVCSHHGFDPLAR